MHPKLSFPLILQFQIPAHTLTLDLFHSHDLILTKQRRPTPQIVKEGCFFLHKLLLTKEHLCYINSVLDSCAGVLSFPAFYPYFMSFPVKMFTNRSNVQQFERFDKCY